MNKIKLLNGLTDIRKDLAERRGYDYSGVEYLEYVIQQIDAGAWKCDECNECNEKKPMSRADILDAAKKCVCGQREQDYGTPESNFQLIANLWNNYLGFVDHDYDITATDVAMMMALMKIARIKNGGGTGDSFVDLAGYAACGGEINSSENHVNTEVKRRSGRYPWGNNYPLKDEGSSENKWIPVSERLPEERDWYLAVFKEKDTGYQLIPRVADYIGKDENKWRLIDEDGLVSEYRDLLECVAWMPLPEPHKASPTGEEVE